MKKNRLYLLLIIVAVVFLFGSAQICTQCALPLTQDTKEASEEDGSSKDTKTEESKDISGTEETEATEAEESTDESTEETPAEEDTSVEEETPDEPISEGGGESAVFTLHPDLNLCGYIVKDDSVVTRIVWVGDLISNKETRGFISFNINELLSSPVVYASLGITGIVSGHDPTFADRLNIKVYYYGDSLDLGDFTFEGDFLASFPTAGLATINVSGETLVNLVQKTINEGKDKFQIKLGLSSATDEDGVADFFQIDPNNAVLTVDQ